MQLAGSVQGTTTAPPRTAPMRCAGFRSILFDHSPGPLDDVSAPAYFSDLNLDQVERALVAGRDDYRLEPYFRTPLVGPELVQYRQEVFADLERRPVRAALDAFAAAMDEVRRCQARASARRPFWEAARWHLEGCLRYLESVRSLGRDLLLAGCRSTGLLSLSSYLDEYVSGQTFGELGVEAAGVARELADIRYTVWIRGARVSVGPTDNEVDWADDIRATFARFADPGGERRGVASPRRGLGKPRPGRVEDPGAGRAGVPRPVRPPAGVRPGPPHARGPPPRQVRPGGAVLPRLAGSRRAAARGRAAGRPARRHRRVQAGGSLGDARDNADVILGEVVKPEPERSVVKRAVTFLKGLLAPIAAGIATGTTAEMAEMTRQMIEGLSGTFPL